jgi:hypothetical protein
MLGTRVALPLILAMAMLRIVNNSDAYVTIDGDPGSYAGAKPEDFLRVFVSDRATLDKHGVDPAHQMVVPWIWAGWGRTQPLWQGDLTPCSGALASLGGCARRAVKRRGSATLQDAHARR